MNTIAILLLAGVVSGTPGEDVAEKIVRVGHKKVGVIPSVISRKGAREATVGSLGPRARTLPKDVHNQLVALSTGKYQGKFSVVSERIMRSALNEVAKNRALNVDDLGNPRALQAIARYTGADGFVALNFDEEEGKSKADIVDTGDDDDTKKDDDDSDKKNDEDDSEKKNDDEKDENLNSKRDNYQKIETQYFDDDGDEFHNDTYRDVNTLGKAAYMGDSFEIRRWSGDKVINVGIRSDHPQFEEDSKWQFGKGKKWEREQFQYLKTTLDHPFDTDGFPYNLKVVVDGEARKPQEVRGKYLIELNPGEEYSVQLINDTQHRALVALYIDGINSIDKELREPADLENGRHWGLKPDHTGNIEGWFMIDSSLKMQKGNKFRIVERSESVAAQKGFEDNIGTITAIFYVNDAASGKLVEYPDDKLLDNVRSVFGESQFGTGSGDEFDKKLEFSGAKRGMMLAAVTLYYRSQEEIEDILSGDSDDSLFDNLDDSDLADNRRRDDDGEGDTDDDKKKDKKKDEDNELKFD